MIKERYEQIKNVLSQYLEKNGLIEIIGEYADPISKEKNGLSMAGLNRDSDVVKQLESLGFKVIYPAPLTEQKIAMMGEQEKGMYDYKINNALFIDSKEACKSLNLEKIIANQYFSVVGKSIGGYDSQNNSVTRYARNDDNIEYNKSYKKLLDEIGFQSEIGDDGNLTISSNVPYPVVKKSKFDQIFDKAKGKMQGAWAKLKALVNTKDKTKENDANERE